MSSLIFDEIESARARFRQDVADQLRDAAVRAGVSATIVEDRERIVLQFNEPLAGGDLPRLVVIFSDDMDGAPGDTVALCIETEEGRTTLLRLGWRNHPDPSEQEATERQLTELQSRTDETVPLERRGLNAAADVRAGPYARGDVLRQLVADFRRAAGQGQRTPQRLRALVPVERPAPVLARTTKRVERTGDSHEHGAQASQDGNVEAQRSNLAEILIAGLLDAMQRDLAEAESHFVGPGVAVSARGRFRRGMEWAMLGTAFGVEAQTNQIAVSSFLGTGAASWLYGLVGPVLIGGLASITRSKAGRGAAYALMITWALATATITASEPGFLDRGQQLFPKQAAVVAQEHAVAAARVRKDATEAELKRLTAPLNDTTSLLPSAKKRWQATEIMRAAKQERELRDKDIAQARKDAIAAGVALSDEELHLRSAMLNDPSRAWAWWTLFAIFGVINLAGPLAISRLLERWQADHVEAEASARNGHRKKSMVALLRGSRSAQKAHAMLLIPELLDRLRRDGAAPEVIAGLDHGDISEKVADRFDRGVNGKRARRSLFGLRGPADGPG